MHVIPTGQGLGATVEGLDLGNDIAGAEVEAVEQIAQANAPLAVGTVGSMEVKPNSPNVVPGEVLFTVDLRHPEAATLDMMEQIFLREVDTVCRPLGLEVKLAKIWDQPPVRFDDACVDAVRQAAKDAGYSVRDMVSGAGHDSAYVARVAPTAMIFVPCRGGISHNEAEFTSQEQCARGAQVLLQAVLAYDRMLAEKKM